MLIRERIGLGRLMAGGLLLGTFPILLGIAVAIKLEDRGSVFYRQKRAGRGRREFWMWKLRTMREGAEKEQAYLSRLNEADGPVFKIRNDPRFTRIGKYLSQTGLDEIPQLWNVVKGEMRLVGPRPLPTYEAELIGKKYEKRWEVEPGLTSWWVVKGAHQLKFDQWMKLDLEYVEKKRWWTDPVIICLTAWGVGRNLVLGMLGSKHGRA